MWTNWRRSFLTPRADLHRREHVGQLGEQTTPSGSLAGDHHVEAEGPPGCGEEVLGTDLARPCVCEALGREAGGIKRQANPGRRKQPRSGCELRPGSILGERE